MKATMHKSCSCSQCKRGRSITARNINERKLRQYVRLELRTKHPEDVFIVPITSPFTD